MEQNVFKFHVQNLSYGWCRVLMIINDKEISFNAEYMGPNPLESFMDVCTDIVIEAEDYDGSHIKWRDRDFVLDIDINMDEKEILNLDIMEIEEDFFSENHKEKVLEEWHEAVPKDIFVAVVKNEGYRLLNAFGLHGYLCSWQGGTEFPIGKLLCISGFNSKIWKRDSCCTNISEELDFIQNQLSELKIKEETKMSECTIYYESWQLQCCGAPFSIGDKVEWTCIMPTGYKNAHGIVLDFEEEHHGFATHSITGTVAKILVERSEFPKGKREAWYDRAATIQEEIRSANGRESLRKDDETTEYTLWGYIVELKDVLVKPLTE